MDLPEENQPAVAPEVTPTPVASETPDAPVQAEAQAEEAAVEETPSGPDPLPPATNTQQDFETFTPLGGAWNDDALTLSLPETTMERTEAFIDAQPNIRLDDTAQGQIWATNLRAANFTVPAKGYFLPTAQRDSASWRQAVKSEKGLLAAGAPGFKETEGAKLTGARAVLRVKALLGMGSLVFIPLWHSGFWITLRAPSDSEMLELNRRIAEEKISLGRQTYGLAYANNSSFFAKHVMDFALAHVYETSLKDDTDIRDKISTLDIPLIAWGLACAQWPRGFQYARSMLDQSTKQAHIVKEKLNVGKLLWTDTASLTEWQVAHMAQRQAGTMTNEAIARYRGEFTKGRGRLVELAPNLSLTLRVPSLNQYLTSGQAWVNNVVQMANGAFGMDDNAEERDQYIMDQGKATNFRQFGHWVETVHAGSNEISDDETLNATFDALSSDDAIREKFFNEVRKFMEDSTVSLVAIPSTEQDERGTLPRFPHLLPLDVLSTFFILLVQLTQQIQSR